MNSKKSIEKGVVKGKRPSVQIERSDITSVAADYLATTHYKTNCLSCKYHKDGWCSIGLCNAKEVAICTNYTWNMLDDAKALRNLKRRKSYKEFQKNTAKRYLPYASTKMLEEELRKRKKEEK